MRADNISCFRYDGKSACKNLVLIARWLQKLQTKLPSTTITLGELLRQYEGSPPGRPTSLSDLNRKCSQSGTPRFAVA